MDEKQATRLREPFRAAQIGHLPKLTCPDCAKVKGGAPWDRHCAKHTVERCKICGAFVSTAHDHVDYVGHGHTTGRLLDVDPEWSWAPVAYGQDGLPQRDEYGGLWMTLTIAGVTRLGYGDAGTKTGPNAIKEAIGDGIRNAAMRFGVALDLWAREDLQATEPVEKSPRGVSRSPARVAKPAAQPTASAPAAPPADEPSRPVYAPKGVMAHGDAPSRSGAASPGGEHVLSTNDLKLPPEARKVITRKQQGLLFKVARGYNMSDQTIRSVVEAVTGSRSTSEITRKDFDVLLERIELEGRGAEA